MEDVRGAAEKKARDDVVLTIASTGEDMEVDKNGSYSLSRNPQPQLGKSSSPSPAVEITEFTNPNSTFATSPTEMPKFSLDPTDSNPPKIPSEPKPKSRFAEQPSPEQKLKSRFAQPPSPEPKPKSRFAQPPSPCEAKSADEKIKLVNPGSANLATPLTGSMDDEEDDESVYTTPKLKVRAKKVGVLMLVEWIAFVCTVGVLICSLTVDPFEDRVIWGLRLWKWCVLVLVIFCGRLFSAWSINIVVFLIQENFLLKEKVLYFLYGVRTNVQVFIWLCSVLLAWGLLINRGVERSKDTARILGYVTRALGGFLIGAVIWLLKTVLVKTDKDKQVTVDMKRLNKLKPGKVSAWAMKRWVDAIRGSWPSTISDTHNHKGELQNKDTDNEKQGKAVTDWIFKNVAKPGAGELDKDDLLKFMKRVYVDKLFHVFGARKTITKSDYESWAVDVYQGRELLARALNDSVTIIRELNRLLSAIALVLVVIVWLLTMGFLTIQVIMLITSQLLLTAFMFGNAAKTVFEAIIFVFVMHTFDVGDHCVIDGEQMVVEEINILTTIFLRSDGEKIFYPNSLLLTKPLSNFDRSPSMSDCVEFDVHISTPTKSISELKDKIRSYLESNPHLWQMNYTLLVKDIEYMNKMKLALYVNHTSNYYVYGHKNTSRSELMLALKEWVEELGIKYHILSQ